LYLFLITGIEGATTSGERYTLTRLKAPVTLDGLSNEPAWQAVRPFPLVTQIPDFGKQASEKTEILAAYDDQYLYIAGRMYDSNPAGIQGTSKKRDDLGPGNDWFGVVLDTFNDKENALGFFTTPMGIRTDMSVFNDAVGEFPINLSWNTFWDVKVVVNGEGWFVEMRIPFSSLRFQDKNGDVVMGLTTWRWIARKYEAVIFPAIHPDSGEWGSFKPSRAREIVLSGIKSRKAFYVAPYILGGYSRTADLNPEETAYLPDNDPAFEAGLDVKYSLSSNLTLDLTVNTDFAQVEADDEQVNLTRFSLFFPEKRLFFQERSGIFDFSLGGNNRLFYSRRIGLYEEQPIRIFGGVRLVGRMGAWDVGFLSMQTARGEVENEDGEMETLPSQNFGVLRIRRRVFNPYSYIGALVTSKIGSNGAYNIAYAIDGIFRLFGDDYLTVNWAQTFETGAQNNPLSLEPTRIRLNWERRNAKGFIYNFDMSRSGEAYDPEMGFQSRENYTRFGARAGYGWLPGESSALLNRTIGMDGFIAISNENRAIESAELGAGAFFIRKSGYITYMMVKGFHEFVDEGFSFNEDENEDDEEDPDVPVGKYSFYGVEAGFVTPQTRPFSIESNLYGGTFYDGRRFSVTLSPRWNISAGLEISGTYQLNHIRFPDRGKTLNTHIARLRTLMMFNTTLSVSAFVQYNSTANTISSNIRLRYNPREGNDLYLVYNEGVNTHRFREIPVLPVTDNRTIMLKYTYTFKF
jgi:hypothetical protein